MQYTEKKAEEGRRISIRKNDKENENEKGLPTRDALGIASSDFMEGQSGEYKVSSAFSC